jgi:CII-binding regulator of phage lambda lysogenization HflD
MLDWTSLTNFFFIRNSTISEREEKLICKIQELEEELTTQKQNLKDLKLCYELTLLNLNTKLFELQGHNNILKRKINKLKSKKKFWFF